MPDRDVFDRTVRKGWRSAARTALTHDCDGVTGEVIERKLLRALAREIRETGLLGFAEVVGVVTRHLESPVPPKLFAVYDELSALKARFGGSSIAILCESAKLCISGGRATPGESGSSVAISERIAVAILANLATARISPAILINELSIGSGLQIGAIEPRREKVYSRLCARVELNKMARRLLEQPNRPGAQIPEIRVRRPQVSQHQILFTPIA